MTINSSDIYAKINVSEKFGRNPYIEEEQILEWAEGKVQKNK
jgi:hypothetical protein